MKFRNVPALSAAVILAACSGEYGASTIDPVTDFGQTIQSLYVNVFAWTMIILVVVWGLLGYTLVRFRARPDSPRPKQTHGHLGLEVFWTFVPAAIVIAIAVPTIHAVFVTQRASADPALVVDVIGHQFWWEFRYEESGVITANELHLPVGRPVSLRLHSADLIHSFWVPQLGGKRDVNPVVSTPEGEAVNYNWLHFTIHEEGTYLGQCAEFCGEAHSLMGMRVIAESEDAFRAWTAAWTAGAPQAQPDSTPPAEPAQAVVAAAVEPQPADPLVEQGRQVFASSQCVACHAIEGTTAQGAIGPNLTLLGRRSTIVAGWLENTPENLERWITDPRSVKPGTLMPGTAIALDEPGRGPGSVWPATNLSPDQVRAVAAYLSSLR